MSKTFEQFHFSLIEREQADLLQPRLSRKDWLKLRFKERFQFAHHGNQFWWVPQSLSTEYIVGVIEREKAQSERTPPDEGAVEIEGRYWTGSMMIIDPQDIPGGQAVAFERNSKVGEPNAILSSLIKHLNEHTEHQYAVQFKALFKGGSFWNFAEKHGGQLEYVWFKFSVPNMIFGAGGGVKKGLRRIGEDTDAQEIELKIESDDGIKADSQAVKEGLAYGEEGNASVTAKALNGDRWHSTKQRLAVKMHSILNFPKAQTEEIQGWLKQALDRDAESVDNGSDNSDDLDRLS